MLTLLCGPMFSGKTDELIRRAHEDRAAGRAILVAKPALDTRHPADAVVSHSGARVDALSVESSRDVAAAAGGAEVVFLDEVQFLDEELPEVVAILRASGAEVVAAGLDLDFRREPFATTRALAAVAQRVESLRGRCGRCGEPATVTQRLVNGVPAPLDDVVVRIGDSDLYEPRCEDCWTVERTALPSGAVPTVDRR